MKSKILTLIIGIVIGAVITAGGFIIYNKVNGNPMNKGKGGMRDMKQMTNEERPEMPSEGNFEMRDPNNQIIE